MTETNHPAPSPARPWVLLLAFLTSAVCVYFVIARWHSAYTNYAPIRAQLDSNEKVKDALAQRGREHALRIPTGLFIQSVRFDDPYTVAVTGLVWQTFDRITLGLIPVEERGVLLPDTVDGPHALEPAYGGWIDSEGQPTDAPRWAAHAQAKHAEAEVVDEIDLEDVVTIADPGVRFVQGWHINSKLRQPFAYDEFPFDVQRAWLRLWPRTLTRGDLELVPDLESYRDTSTLATFGLDDNIALDGWQIVESCFALRDHSYDTDLGVDRFKIRERDPNATELYFDVVLRREFMNPLVQDLLPILIVLALIFGLLTTVSPRASGDAMGFSFAGTLATAAGLFFAVIVGHAHLRGETGGTGVVYLEYFYLLGYVAIGAVVLVSFAVAQGWIGQARAPGSLGALELVKIGYWPCISALSLVTTLLFVHPDSAPSPLAFTGGGSASDVRAWVFWPAAAAAFLVLLALLLALRSLRSSLARVDTELARLRRQRGTAQDNGPGDAAVQRPKGVDPIDTFEG